MGQCMNGSAAARALKQDFARVGHAEVIRLGRKLATLDAEQRAIVEGVVGNVVEALAADAVRLLAAQPEQHVVDIVVHLFGLTGGARAGVSGSIRDIRGPDDASTRRTATFGTSSTGRPPP